MDAAAEFVRQLLASLLGSGIAASAVAARSARRLARSEHARADVDRACAALEELRQGAYGRSAGHLEDLETRLALAAARVSEPAVEAANAYIRAAGGYAVARDASAAAAEQAAFHMLVDVLLAERALPPKDSATGAGWKVTRWARRRRTTLS